MIPMLGGRRQRTLQTALVEESPLRRADARAKLAISVCVSLAVMSPWLHLAGFIAAFSVFLAWARLLPHAARQVWRQKWVLLLLFIVDWLVVGSDLAVTITLRLVVLACAFVLFFATTSPAELCLALEQLRAPYRYAFSISLAYQSLELLSQEWRAIHEAQRARGANSLPQLLSRKTSPGGVPAADFANPARGRRGFSPAADWRRLIARVRDLVALAVPAIVLTTKRAWAITEAAHARGFDSPHRQPYRLPVMRWTDWLLVAGAAMTAAVLLFWR